VSRLVHGGPRFIHPRRAPPRRGAKNATPKIAALKYRDHPFGARVDGAVGDEQPRDVPAFASGVYARGRGRRVRASVA
jgi:hypothetical protein